MNLAVGNAVGSNITNVALVLGVTALVVPIAYDRKVIQSSVLILLAAMVGVAAMFYDGTLDFIDGVILISALTGYSLWLVKSARSGDESAEQSDEEKPT